VEANRSVTYNAVGQEVQYRYNVKNTGDTPLPGPVTITITGATVTTTCPDVNTIGNKDGNLDAADGVLICTGSYLITQADLDRGEVTTITTANVNNILSAAVTTNVPTVPNKVLTLTKTASPTTYNEVGQTITYTYLIKNSGTVDLGPAQFTVSDAGINAGAPINCPDATVTTLTPNATVTCTAKFVIGQTDLGVASIATNATASGGGAGASQPVNATVTNTKVSPQPGTSSYTRGSTITHTVQSGEWLWQIARCYGANPTRVIAANPQLANPAQISPNTTLSVPDIGSDGTIYGPPCVVTHTVVNGDTWASIAQKYNASQSLLQQVNPGALTVGRVLTVPRNSVGVTGSVTTTPTSSLDATRITFNAGATSATVTGIALAGNRTVHYVLNASQGQLMTVKLTASANSASVAIYAPNGTMLKQADLTPTWSGTLAATGDYRIDVSNALGLGAPDVPFTLEVSVTGGATGATDTCVDVARNLNPLGPTHFKICGTLDASGKLKVTSIHIYQKPEDVGQGGFTQDITVTDNILTPTNDANALVIADMNGDTWDDFRILNSQPGANPTYLYFFYNVTTDQFVSNGVR
jgi:uncharacterized repeat protein (TIGR01451 family)